MIIDSETKRKLREMNAAELLDAFERLDERTVMPLNHAEVVGLAVDNAYGGYTDAKIQRLVKRAGLRYPQADLRTIDLAEERGLDRGVLAGLDAGNYLGQRLNVAFQGATGSGKSFLLCALVKSACRGRYRACYIRMPDLAEQVAADDLLHHLPVLARPHGPAGGDRRLRAPPRPQRGAAASGSVRLHAGRRGLQRARAGFGLGERGLGAGFGGA